MIHWTKFLLLPILLLTSCERPFSENEKTLYRVIRKHSTLPSTQELNTIGAGGAVPDKIHEIIIDYNMKKAVDLKEARAIFLKHISTLIQVANRDPGMERCAIKYPIDYDNVTMAIMFADKDGEFQTEPYIARVSNVCDTIIYKILQDNQFVEVGVEKLPPLPFCTKEKANSSLGSDDI